MAQRLSDLQLALMRVLWERDEATVTEVHEAIVTERPLAVTTVATLLSRLEKKGLVGHRAEGRQYVYHTEVSETDVRREMLDGLANSLFEGDLTELVCHLLQSREMSGQDLEKVKELIEAEERKKAGEDHGQSPLR